VSDMSIDERRAIVARLHAEGKTQREIAAEVGVDHATVSRDLAALRLNGQHQADADQPVTVVAGADDEVQHQPAETGDNIGAGAQPAVASNAVLHQAVEVLLQSPVRGAPRGETCHRYLIAGAAALPAYEERRRRRIQAAHDARERQAAQEWAKFEGYFSALPTFREDWQPTVEPDTTATNLVALQPRFPLPLDVDLYLHVVLDNGDLWLQGSRGGRYVLLLPNQDALGVEQVLGLALRFGLEAAARRG
jgi:Helix-turn-helix domain